MDNILYPDLKRAPAKLENGWHTVVIHSIGEYTHREAGQSAIKIEFLAQYGAANILLPMNKESIFILNKLAGIAGILSDKYRLSDIVNATVLIQIKYKRVIKIKKP